MVRFPALRLLAHSGLAVAGLGLGLAAGLEAQASGVLQTQVSVVSSRPAIQLPADLLRKAVSKGGVVPVPHPAELGTQIQIALLSDSVGVRRRIRITVIH